MKMIRNAYDNHPPTPTNDGGDDDEDEGTVLQGTECGDDCMN
jgi:hypothetical protein